MEEALSVQEFLGIAGAGLVSGLVVGLVSSAWRFAFRGIYSTARSVLR